MKVIKISKATRKKAKLRLALLGPAGGGKTYSALAIATSIARAEGGRVLVVDTEEGSASKYADGHPFDFDTVDELPDHEPETYIAAMNAAAEAGGYSVVVLDSLSHAWASVLEAVDAAARASGKGDSFGAWRAQTPRQMRLVEAILRAPFHVIGTVRTKMETVREGSTIRKVGLKPVQRDGLEYEFDVVIDLDDRGDGLVTKTRCSAIAGKVIHYPGAELAKTLLDWLNTGIEPPRPAGWVPPTTTEEGWAIVHETMGTLDGAMTLEELTASWKAWAAKMNNGSGQHVAKAQRDGIAQYAKRAGALLGGKAWEPTDDEAALVELLRSSRQRAVLEQQPPPDVANTDDDAEAPAAE